MEDSKRALEESQGMILNGRSIRCEPARVNRTLCLISSHSAFDESVSRLGMTTDLTDSST